MAYFECLEHSGSMSIYFRFGVFYAVGNISTRIYGYAKQSAAYAIVKTLLTIEKVYI